MEVAVIFLVALGTALATGLGALPLLVWRTMTPLWLGLSNALAAGFMLGASLGLLYEGSSVGTFKTAGGAALGVAFVAATHGLLDKRTDLHLGALRGASATRALLVIGVMTLHSFTEGVGVGVSFGDSSSLGILIAAAIAVHNIPEGLAISLALVPAGTSVRAAAGWSIFSSLPQPLMALPAFLGVRVFDPLLAVGLGFAGGAMLWMVFAHIVPEALKTTSGTRVALATIGSAALMLAMGSALAF